MLSDDPLFCYASFQILKKSFSSLHKRSIPRPPTKLHSLFKVFLKIKDKEIISLLCSYAPISWYCNIFYLYKKMYHSSDHSSIEKVVFLSLRFILARAFIFIFIYCLICYISDRSSIYLRYAAIIKFISNNRELISLFLKLIAFVYLLYISLSVSVCVVDCVDV